MIFSLANEFLLHFAAISLGSMKNVSLNEGFCLKQYLLCSNMNRCTAGKASFYRLL